MFFVNFSELNYKKFQFYITRRIQDIKNLVVAGFNMVTKDNEMERLLQNIESSEAFVNTAMIIVHEREDRVKLIRDTGDISLRGITQLHGLLTELNKIKNWLRSVKKEFLDENGINRYVVMFTQRIESIDSKIHAVMKRENRVEERSSVNTNVTVKVTEKRPNLIIAAITLVLAIAVVVTIILNSVKLIVMFD